MHLRMLLEESKPCVSGLAAELEGVPVVHCHVVIRPVRLKAQIRREHVGAPQLLGALVHLLPGLAWPCAHATVAHAAQDSDVLLEQMGRPVYLWWLLWHRWPLQHRLGQGMQWE